MSIAHLSEQEQIRRDKRNELEKIGIDPYPAALYPVSHYSADIKAQFSEEHKRSLSMALKGKPSNFKGKHHSEEAKRKIKIARKGKKQTEETIKKRVLMLRGKKRSEEQKRNISESKKGKKRSEETKKKIKETTKKTWNTPEMKEQARLRRLKQKFPKRETSIERKNKRVVR